MNVIKKLLVVLFLGFASHAFAQAATPLFVGDAVSMAVTADGTKPFTYKWFKNGVVIAGQVSNVYAIAAVALTDAGTYTAQVTNPAGSYTTNVPAVLSVSQVIVAPTNTVITVTVTPAPKPAPVP